MAAKGTGVAEHGRVDESDRYQFGLLSSGAMAPSTREDPTAKLDTAKMETATTELGGTIGDGRPPPWHDRPFVLVAASLVGVVGLIALALSVVDMSADSTHPAHAPASAVSTTTTPAPQPTNPTTVVASSEPSSLPSPTSVPDFAAGPTAEMEISPTAAPPAAAAPFRLPRWLRRLLHQGDAPD
jgi:hypothetical protein